MNTKQLNKLDGIKHLIGNTPLLEISYEYEGRPRKIYAKAEHYNMTGSIKDRVAYYILHKAYERGEISEGDIIAEATSGNTGISFSAVGSFLGHEVQIFMPDWMSKERINIIEGYGATIKLVSREQGGFIGSIKMTEDLAANGGVFLPCQFSNYDNVMTHYETTAPEIARQLESIGLKPDAVVAGVGTGGTIMGIAQYMKEHYNNCKCYPIQPLSSPTLSTGNKVGKHKIQGISDEFIPDIVKLNQLDDILSIGDDDSIIMAQMLSQKLGIGVGISSGANFIGCVLAQNMQSDDAVAVTVFADDNKKYLSTDYADKIEIKDEYVTSKIKLISVKAYK